MRQMWCVKFKYRQGNLQTFAYGAKNIFFGTLTSRTQPSVAVPFDSRLAMRASSIFETGCPRHQRNAVTAVLSIPDTGVAPSP